MIGVPNIEPNTPPLLIVKVPPSMSSMARSSALACNYNMSEDQLKHDSQSNKTPWHIVKVMMRVKLLSVEQSQLAIHFARIFS